MLATTDALRMPTGLDDAMCLHWPTSMAVDQAKKPKPWHKTGTDWLAQTQTDQHLQQIQEPNFSEFKFLKAKLIQ